MCMYVIMDLTFSYKAFEHVATQINCFSLLVLSKNTCHSEPAVVFNSVATGVEHLIDGWSSSKGGGTSDLNGGIKKLLPTPLSLHPEVRQLLLLPHMNDSVLVGVRERVVCANALE